jgi:hypothetical protein
MAGRTGLEPVTPCVSCRLIRFVDVRWPSRMCSDRDPSVRACSRAFNVVRVSSYTNKLYRSFLCRNVNVLVQVTDRFCSSYVRTPANPHSQHLVKASTTSLVQLSTRDIVGQILHEHLCANAVCESPNRLTGHKNSQRSSGNRQLHVNPPLRSNVPDRGSETLGGSSRREMTTALYGKPSPSWSNQSSHVGADPFAKPCSWRAKARRRSHQPSNGCRRTL